jgi:hypothetical protein
MPRGLTGAPTRDPRHVIRVNRASRQPSRGTTLGVGDGFGVGGGRPKSGRAPANTGLVSRRPVARVSKVCCGAVSVSGTVTADGAQPHGQRQPRHAHQGASWEASCRQRGLALSTYLMGSTSAGPGRHRLRLDKPDARLGSHMADVDGMCAARHDRRRARSRGIAERRPMQQGVTGSVTPSVSGVTAASQSCSAMG